MASVWTMHVLGKKHLHFTPNKITVTGQFDSNRIDEVHEYFSTFGTIGSKKVTSQDDKISIEYCFQDKRAHSKIIYKEHRMFNQFFEVSWNEVTAPLNFIVPNRNTGPSESDSSMKRKPAAKKIDSESSKRAILDTVKIAHTFSDQVSILYNNLQADKDDLEQKKQLIYDDITSALSSMFALNKIYFFGSSVTGLDMQGSDLDIYIANVREDTRPEVMTLKVIRHLIFKCRKFCDVLLISGAKTPIIKCIHTKTQICCDLNIKNKLSVCNSQLIRYYLSLDDKLRPLMIMIKYWAECYDLKKHEPYNLPSVRDLQKDIAPDLVEGWNCAFNINGYANLALKHESMTNLVKGFFKFYSNFDYITYGITPYSGRAIPKTCFLKPYDLEGYDEYKNCKHGLTVSSGILIQDPFEHSRNVAASVPFQCVGRFMLSCKSSLQLMEGQESEMLYKVLTQKIPTDYAFQLFKCENVNDSETDWTESVKNIAMKILTEILNMKVETRKNPLSYHCKSDQNIWDNRVNIYKNLLTQLAPDTHELDREIAATKCIIKYFPQTLPLELSVDFSFKQDPDRAEFVLKQINKKSKNFTHAAHFFHVKLVKFLAVKPGESGEKPGTPVLMKTEVRSDSVVEPQHFEDMVKKENDRDAGKQIEFQAGDLPQEGGKVQTSDDLEGETSIPSDLEKELLAEDEEEDIPADFFDDFSNQDFMDGLDIVDAWDDDKLVDTDSKESEERSLGKDKKHSPIRFISSKSPDKKAKKYKSRSQSKSPRRHRPEMHRRRSRSRSREKLKLDRRDPEKTKRDIHKDKLKVVKDREQKLVSDKLRIVETGLVPPGTEMDVDLNAIFKEKEKEKEKERAREREKEKERTRSTTGSSAEKAIRARSERERDREKRYNRRSVSRERKPLRRSPTPPVYRTRMRDREPIYRPRKRTSSMDSNLSDREKWIRSARKRSRSRDRESPRRTKAKKYEEAKKKKTFLEEIRDKLNETRPPVVAAQPQYGVPYASGPQPIPAPVPAPAQYFQPGPNPTLQQYDQSFFIGDAYQRPGVVLNQNVIQPGFGMIGNTGSMPAPHVAIQPIQSPMQVPAAPVVKPEALVSPKLNILSDVTVSQIKLQAEKKERQETMDDADKLFADKKISLSDFLAITAKCEVQSSSPEHLQKKIKVISRCQDAIRAMSDDRKFSGRLAVRLSSDSKNKTEVKYQSPLRRIPIVRFQFTSPAKLTEEVDSFAVALDKILQKVGVLKETVDLDESADSVPTVSNSSFADEETSLSLRASLLNSKKFEVKSECEECKKRKSKSFAEVGSQCADNKETVSISTQVTDEDLNPKPKNASIAYLTPAQLLGKEKEKEPEKVVLLPTPENVEKKQETSNIPLLLKKEKKPPNFKPRGGFRKTLRDRPANTFYDYDYEEEFDFYDRGRPMFDDPRESFGNRYGGPPARFQRQFTEEETAPVMHRLHQFRENDGNFTDFAQPYRGRGRAPRF